MKKAHDDGAFDKLYAQRRAEAEARHQALRDEGDAGAAKADRLEKGLDHDKNTRKRKKEKGEALALKEAQLTERGAALLVELERGGSTELDDDGAVEPLDMEPFRADEEALKALRKARDDGEGRDDAGVIYAVSYSTVTFPLHTGHNRVTLPGCHYSLS